MSLCSTVPGFTVPQELLCHSLPMRSLMVLLAALMFGLLGGYGWSVMARRPQPAHVPKVPKPEKLVIPDSAADKQWEERADENEIAPATVASHSKATSSSSENQAEPANAG